MLSRSAKQDLIDQFRDAFKANPSVMVVEYKGLSVKEMEGLRQNLRAADTELKVIKNSLLKIASKDTDIEKISDLFVGPTAVAICRDDPASAAKVFVKSTKDLPSLVIKGGIVDGNILNEVQISDLSKLPSRIEMIAQFMGLISTPMSNFVGTLVQMQTKLLYALTALKEARDDGGAGEGGGEAGGKEPEKAADAGEEQKAEAPEEPEAEAEEPAEAKAEAEEASEEGAPETEAAEGGEADKEEKEES